MNDSISENKKRHDALINLLSTFPQYQGNDRKPTIKKRAKEINSKDVLNLSCNEINSGVVVLTDFLHLSGGSIGGGIDLYRLLQSYFLDVDKREMINNIVDSK